MDEADVFPFEAADVAMQAIKDGVARINMTREEAYNKAKKDIDYSRQLVNSMYDNGFLPEPPKEIIEEALNFAINKIKNKS
jgi:malate dehydrogenase (oxaloacetate-decarboxylating)